MKIISNCLQLPPTIVRNIRRYLAWKYQIDAASTVLSAIAWKESKPNLTPLSSLVSDCSTDWLNPIEITISTLSATDLSAENRKSKVWRRLPSETDYKILESGGTTSVCVWPNLCANLTSCKKKNLIQPFDRNSIGKRFKRFIDNISFQAAKH